MPYGSQGWYFGLGSAPAPISLEPWLAEQPVLLLPHSLTVLSYPYNTFGTLNIWGHHKSFFLAEKWMLNGIHIYNQGLFSPCQGLLHHQVWKILLSALCHYIKHNPSPPEICFNGIALKSCKKEFKSNACHSGQLLTQSILPRGTCPVTHRHQFHGLGSHCKVNKQTPGGHKLSIEVAFVFASTFVVYKNI